MKKILIIEDDVSISLLIKSTLEMLDFSAVVAESLKSGYDLVSKESFDLIILDLGLPDGEGIDILKTNKKKIPIIILTARCELEEKINGLKMGADDYITKPFEPVELIARINAVLRRYNSQIIRDFKFDNILIKLDEHIVLKDNKVLDLTPKEFELISYLTRSPGFAIKRESIISHIWGYDSDCTTRTVDIHIQRLRKKLQTKRIETVYKVGYRFNHL